MLPAYRAVYPALFDLRKQNSAAISIKSLAVVNHIGGQTPPPGRYIQISARGIARRRSANLHTKLPKESFGFFLSELPYHLLPQRRFANVLLINPRHLIERRRRRGVTRHKRMETIASQPWNSPGSGLPLSLFTLCLCFDITCPKNFSIGPLHSRSAGLKTPLPPRFNTCV